MGPKAKPAAAAAADSGEVKTLTIKVVGGEPPSNAVLSARLAPFGCNPKKSGEEIAKQTKEYTNIRLYVTLHIQAREIKKVDLLPTSSAYIIKELKEPVRQRRKVKAAVFKHSGNITFKAVKEIADKMNKTKSNFWRENPFQKLEKQRAQVKWDYDAIFGVYEAWAEIKIQKLQDEIVDIIQQNILLQSTYIDIDFYDILEVAYQKVINEMVKR